MMKNYFERNGKKYYSRTVILIRDGDVEKEATFVYYQDLFPKYCLKLDGKYVMLDRNIFKSRIVAVTDKIDTTVNAPIRKKRPDSEIDGLATAWIWYIVLMTVFSIFKYNIGIWCLLSFYFFTWRAKKIEKEGYYYEWKV